MRIRPSLRPQANTPGWQCQTPAKINLFLEVLGKRPDGYHNLDTVMLAIDLTDCLEIYPSDTDELTLELDLSEAQTIGSEELAQDDKTWEIPTQASGSQANLVLRALDMFRTQLDSCADRSSSGKRCGAHVILRKRIPSQAGLGGGSSDAAAAIVLGSLLWNQPYDPVLFGSIASKLGSDINFFLDGYNGQNWTARCTQRGQIVEPVANTCPIHGVVVHPPAGCQTAAVFSLVRDSIENRQSACSPDALLDCLALGTAELGQAARLGQLLYNRLDAAALQTTPWVERTASRIEQCDTLGQCLSGSGSARFCLCADRVQAESMAAKLQREGNFRAYPFSTWTSPSIGDQITAFP